MKKRWFHSSGFTLTEILVAAIVSSIVFAGVLAVSLTLSKISLDYTRDTRLYMQIAAIAERMRNDVQNAVGDASPIATCADPFGCCTASTTTGAGIRLCPAPGGVAANNWFCFRSVLTAPAAPYDYASYNWSCYSLDTNRIRVCSVAAPAHCAAGTDLGPVVSDVFTCNGGVACYPPRLDAQHYVEFQFVNRHNSPTVETAHLTAGGALTAGTPVNPQAFINYRVYPERHSF